jgi:hypothetical protein
MPKQIPTELEGWDELNNISGGDSVPIQNRIKVGTSHKTVLALSNLGNNIFSLQKILGNRLDGLNKKLDEESKSSEKQSRRMYWLTIALVVATVVQAVAATLSVIIATNNIK